MQLSVAIVCKDNADTIGRTLTSVRTLAEELDGPLEIVAVDSGSTDETIPLLEQADARIIRSDWLGYVKTKQKALEACAGDWILALDSDEAILPDLAESIRQALLSPGARTGFMVNRKVYYRGRPLDHAWQPEWRLRLVKRGLFRWIGLDPHDHLAPVDAEQRIARLAGDLRHDSIEGGFGEFLAKQARHAQTMARSMHAEGKRGSALKLVTSPWGAMVKQLVLKRAFLDGPPGWMAAAATATGTMMKHIALIELTRTTENPPPDGPKPG